MMLLGQQPVSGTNLREGAATVEAERGVMIDFSVLQFLILAGEIRVVSFLAANHCLRC